MEIYYRSFETDSPITSGAKHITAFAARLALSMLRSVKHLDDAAYDAFVKVVTVENLWALCIIMGGWMLSAVIGGPVGAAVSAILLYLGVREFYDRIAEIYTPLKEWLTTAYEAKNDDDLERAAHHFAKGLAEGGIMVLEFVVLHKLFKATETRLLKRFPPPQWMRTTWDRTVGERLRRRSRPEPKPSSATDDKTGAVPLLAGALQTQGARRAAASSGGFPIVPVLAVGVGVVATVAIVAAVREAKK